MKNPIYTFAIISGMLGGTLSAEDRKEAPNRSTGNQMIIRIGAKTFTATLVENATTTAFKAMLPLTLAMDDLNANEKVARLSAALPVNDSNPGRIQAGDLMIWSSRSLVLFYKDFPTSYSYTKLGRIDDAAGLSAAVDSGNVKAIFELKPQEAKATHEPAK